jgi:enoyl-CoA hydratase/carnithine racemase
MKTSTERMIARKDGPIGWMQFNNPARHNAVSVDMWKAVPEIMTEFENDDQIRVVVLSGAGGKAFISGADISEFAEKRSSRENILEYNRIAGQANAAIIDFPKPTIAMIQGYCIGGGLSVALCCDLRLAAENASFAVPAAKLGLDYAYDGIKRLVDVVGPSFAKEIFYTARQFDSTEALQMGLVNRVVPTPNIETYVRDYAGAIGSNAPLTINSVKLCVNEATRDPDKRNLVAAQIAVDACFASADYVEGRTAFIEKRKPAFRGRLTPTANSLRCRASFSRSIRAGNSLPASRTKDAATRQTDERDRPRTGNQDRPRLRDSRSPPHAGSPSFPWSSPPSAPHGLEETRQFPRISLHRSAHRRSRRTTSAKRSVRCPAQR